MIIDKNKLLVILADKGLTISQLVSETVLSRNTVYKMLNEKPVRLSTIIKLIQYLNIKSEDILKGGEK